jgi:hypothetical protein
MKEHLVLVLLVLVLVLVLVVVLMLLLKDVVLLEDASSTKDAPEGAEKVVEKGGRDEDDGTWYE